MNAERPQARPVRQKAPQPGLFGLLIVIVVIAAVGLLYWNVRGEGPVRAEEAPGTTGAPVDPFEGLPPEEPPAKQAETKGEAARNGK